MKVFTYSLTSRGRHIRNATAVRLDDGQVIAFMDKMPAYVALKQVKRMTKRELEAATVR